jgi:hypothetical protein
VPLLSNVQRLDRIDWNFPRAGTISGSVHTLHWFPGNFIPQIPAALIQVLSKPGDLVLDPFGGGGTTGIEAMRLARRAIISDRMSVCVFIAAAKLALLGGALNRRSRGELLALLTFEQQCRSDRVGLRGEGCSPELALWYSPDTLAQLRYIWTLIEVQSPPVRRVLRALFSDVLFDCASTGQSATSTGKPRRHHWGWVADNVRPKSFIEHNAIAFFRERLAALNEQSAPPTLQTSLVVQHDARWMPLPDEVIDLVVTSPPYIGVIDYTHANRLLYTWMCWPMEPERRDEIGARFRRKRLTAVAEYLSDMRAARDECWRVLRSGAFCAIVIGESKKFPGTVERTIAEFNELMPLVWGPHTRRPSRRRVSDRAAREAVEFVCVFRKP